MRGPIAKEKLKPFFTSIIDSRETERLIMSLDPRQFAAGEQVQAAIVSLQDAVATFQAARYALIEAQAHLAHYGTNASGNPIPAAVFFAQFYVEDAYLRLPRAADLVATTLALYLEIPSKEMEREQRSAGSASCGLANYLTRHLQDSSIAKAFQRLTDREDWKFLINLRDSWVRGKAIRIQGVGVAHSRQVGWAIMEENHAERTARDFGMLLVNPVVRRTQAEYGLPTLFARATGAYNAMVTLLHQIYEELARSAK